LYAPAAPELYSLPLHDALPIFQFPIDLNETSRAFFRLWEPMAPEEARPVIRSILEDPADPQVSSTLVKHPYFNALARTTCVATQDRKSTRLNSSHVKISYAVFC